MSAYLVDMEGRFRLTKKPPFLTPGYQAVGQKLADVKGIHEKVPLDKYKTYDVPLHPQQTVVQFNSTYLETTGRNERRRGDAVGWGLFLGFIIVSMTPFIYHISIQLNNDFNFFSLGVGVFGIASILITYVLLINMLSTELFTTWHSPIRFNRKTRKVYVRQYNRKVEVYNWDDLTFFIAYINEDRDIRAVTFDKNGETITGMFALAFQNNVFDKSLISYFEFIRRYMEGDDQQLKEVKEAVRYIYPIHKKRETPLMSFKRLILNVVHYSHENMEYPERTFRFYPVTIVILPLLALRYVGRVISMLTSYRHQFSKAIEAECQIDPNDPYDLNKHLPEGNLEQNNEPIWKTIVYSVGVIIATIIMLFIGAFIIDMIGAARPHGDYPSMVDKLWYVIGLGWLS
ncbi:MULTISPECIES: DUF6708 domain-containing protein [Psychrobacter]|uniref:DUF6708 domain-containing protein n=1 Tax=Psychrobacter TaxID=497 RepID=UPI000C34E89C|nr:MULTISPECIES: DUF6708 domain-containing protein [Psychrobacter]PKG36761.1 hypothetical protein CXF65_00685 [Psychrobacter sp. Sarcosine-3u-12]